MPELPEVERARRHIESICGGRRIERCRCANDRIVFDGVTPTTVSRRLKNRRVEAVRRRGKQLWVELDARPWPLFHLGMTGHWRSPGDDGLVYEGGAKRIDESWPPKFWKIHLVMEDGGEIAMTNARRLGRIRMQDDPESEAPLMKLGFDALDEIPPARTFASMLEGRRGTVKGLLMDQSFAAGVGNWIADEVLYQAKIDPRRKIDTLDASEVRALRSKLTSVVRKACDVDADKSRFPRTWLFHRRWGKDADATTHDGRPIEHITLGGRTTAWVPSVQS